MDDAGKYVCIAQNELGEASSPAWLHIEGKWCGNRGDCLGYCRGDCCGDCCGDYRAGSYFPRYIYDHEGGQLLRDFLINQSPCKCMIIIK